MEFSILFRVVGIMNLILFYVVHSVFKGENPYVVLFRSFTVNLYEIQYVATACWFGEFGAKSSLHKLLSAERTLLT